MKNKIGKDISRFELADHLEHLAKQLRSGNFEADGRQWSIPDTLQTKIRHKEKKGRINTKLTWRWSTLEEYEEAAREEVTRWKNSWKAVKKRLTRSFKKVEKTVANDELPDKETLADFIKESRKMAKFADPEWQEAMDEYIDHLGTLKHAVEENQLDVVRHEIRDLRNRMMQCHRDFR
jgi:XXXCH domain-containing protein